MTAFAYQSHDSTAVVGRRIGAWFIDLIIYLVLAFSIQAAIPNNAAKTYDLTGANVTPSEFCSQWKANHSGLCFDLSSSSTKQAFTYQSTAYPFIIVFGHMALYALVQGLLGGSLGKLAVGLRVVDEDGNLCGVGKSFIRTFLWIIDGITFALPIVGGVLMVSTKGHRRVGDMAAHTYVVDKGEVGHPVQIPGVTAPAAGIPGPPPAGAWGAPQQPWGQPGPGGQPWGPPGGTSAGGWAQPGTPAQQPPADQPAAVDAPRWDPDRNTYIQWDTNRSAWLEWDDTAKEWKPIST